MKKEPPKTKNINANYECILNEKDLDSLIKRLTKAKLIALDTETDGLDFTTAELVGISLSAKEGEGAYIPLGHNYENAPKQLKRIGVKKT
ncbi:MAG: hypothetical protein CM15mP22_2930 [Gammaproteobacteria bacterium]|nr:MAG: hypothetical protein CM15mP22_2930 [Gammaproteobacteria bacterium]